MAMSNKVLFIRSKIEKFCLMKNENFIKKTTRTTTLAAEFNYLISTQVDEHANSGQSQTSYHIFTIGEKLISLSHQSFICSNF